MKKTSLLISGTFALWLIALPGFALASTGWQHLDAGSGNATVVSPNLTTIRTLTSDFTGQITTLILNLKQTSGASSVSAYVCPASEGQGGVDCVFPNNDYASGTLGSSYTGLDDTFDFAGKNLNVTAGTDYIVVLQGECDASCNGHFSAQESADGGAQMDIVTSYGFSLTANPDGKSLTASVSCGFNTAVPVNILCTSSPYSTAGGFHFSGQFACPSNPTDLQVNGLADQTTYHCVLFREADFHIFADATSTTQTAVPGTNPTSLIDKIRGLFKLCDPAVAGTAGCSDAPIASATNIVSGILTDPRTYAPQLPAAMAAFLLDEPPFTWWQQIHEAVTSATAVPILAQVTWGTGSWVLIESGTDAGIIHLLNQQAGHLELWPGNFVSWNDLLVLGLDFSIILLIVGMAFELTHL